MERNGYKGGKSMKKIMNLAAVAMTVLAFVSCAKERIVSDANVKREAKLVVTATNGTKTFLSLGKNISWVKADKLIGFNEEGSMYVSEACQMEEGKNSQPSGKFSFTEWTGVPKYFMFNFEGGNNPYADAAVNGEQVEAYVNEEQRAQDDNISFCRWSPVLVGVASKKDDSEVYTTTLANVTAFLKVSFGYCSTVQSLKISSKEKVDLAGKVAISTSSIEDGEPTIVEVLDGKKDIVLTVSASAGKDVESAEGKTVKCFKVGSTYAYYISVIPGKFTPVLTFTDVNGNEYTKEGSVTAEVKRGEYFDLGVIDASLCFDESARILPETLVFNLGKTWNFLEAAPVEGDYSNEKYGKASEEFYGETYNYDNSKLGLPGPTYQFNICRHYNGSNVDGRGTDEEAKNKTGYYFSSEKGIVFLRAGAEITLPAVPNYRLSKIEYSCNKDLRLGNTFGFISSQEAYAEKYIATLPATEASYEPEGLLSNTQYFIYIGTSTQIEISDLKLTYTKCSSSDLLILGYDYPLGTDVNVINVFSGVPTLSKNAADVIFDQRGCQFVPSSGSTWYFNAGTGKNGLTNSSVNSWLKLPKIPGYKLAKVKFGTTQTSNKTVKICYAVEEVSEIDNLVEIASTTINSGHSSVLVSDPYDASKDYYYLAPKSTTLRSFLLTYKPI